MNRGTPLAIVWNTILIILAAGDLIYGSGKVAAAIIGGMLVGGVLAVLAGRLTNAIAETLPWASAASGTIFTVIYWMLRVKIWLDQHMPSN